MSKSRRSNNLVGLWQKKTKKGNKFYVSNNVTFGELRNFLKEFKETEEIIDNDLVNFFLFEVDSEHEQAPTYHLTIAKNTYEGK